MSHCTWWPPSNLHPASFLFLSGWVWCRLTWRGWSLQRVPPVCQPPGRSLNWGTERGTCTMQRWGERSPRVLSLCTTPTHLNPTPLYTPHIRGGLGFPEQKTLSSTERSFCIFCHNLWKSRIEQVISHMQDNQPAVWFMEVILQKRTVCWLLSRKNTDLSVNSFLSKWFLPKK